MIDLNQQKIITGLWIWAISIVALYLFYESKTKKSAGLSFIFIGDLAINHLFGAIIYLLPWYLPSHGYILSYSIAQVAEGFILTSYGVLAFCLGNMIVPPLICCVNRAGPLKKNDVPVGFPIMLIYIGVFFYFILKPLQKIGSLATLSHSGWLLMQVGLCLILWANYQQRRFANAVLWLIAGVVFFPCFTLISLGFMSYAIRALLIILCFLCVFYKAKWQLILVLPVLLYFGATVYVNYMAARDDIREAVWGGATLNARVEVIKSSFSKMTPFDAHNIKHLETIDMRLNQNVFIGCASDYLTSGYKSFAKGKTLTNAFLAMIPRVLWPGKPVIGGSGGLVAEYTGLNLNDETSFGVGFPLEFYLNYGQPCIVFGFLFLGIVVGCYDYQSGIALYSGNLIRFLFFFLPGLALTNTLGSLSEAAASFAASYVFLFSIRRILERAYRKSARKSAVKPEAELRANKRDLSMKAH